MEADRELRIGERAASAQISAYSINCIIVIVITRVYRVHRRHRRQYLYPGHQNTGQTFRAKRQSRSDISETSQKRGRRAHDSGQTNTGYCEYGAPSRRESKSACALSERTVSLHWNGLGWLWAYVVSGSGGVQWRIPYLTSVPETSMLGRMAWPLASVVIEISYIASVWTTAEKTEASAKNNPGHFLVESSIGRKLGWGADADEPPAETKCEVARITLGIFLKRSDESVGSERHRVRIECRVVKNIPSASSVVLFAPTRVTASTTHQMLTRTRVPLGRK